MFSATTYTIRIATADDESALRRLAELDSGSAHAAGPYLVGEVDGTLQAALSLWPAVASMPARSCRPRSC